MGKALIEHAAPNVLLVAVDEADAVVGFTAVHPRDCEMYLLFVHPAHAGRGVGRALLDAAHEALRPAGCRQVFLYAHEENRRALAVYEAAGYRRDGSVRESDFRGVHLREPRLVKLLGPVSTVVFQRPAGAERGGFVARRAGHVCLRRPGGWPHRGSGSLPRARRLSTAPNPKRCQGTEFNSPYRVDDRVCCVHCARPPGMFASMPTRVPTVAVSAR
jgi:GNAT superfamily N-acetyltransferase